MSASKTFGDARLALATRAAKAVGTAAVVVAATLGAVFPVSWKLPERVPIVEFCEQHRKLSARSSASPGPMRFDRFPYVRGIMEMFTDPRVRWLTIVAASQTTKTTMAENFLFYSVVVDPTPAMWVFASEDLRDQFVKERLKPAIECSPLWAEHVSPGQWSVSSSQASFTTMPLFYALAESESSLSSKPCGLVICDETGKFPANTTNEGSPIDQARARQRTFPRRKFVDTSSVTGEFDGIWPSYKSSNMCEWMVACPECGERASWERSDIKWDERPAGVAMLDWASRIEAKPDMAWWQCPHCSHQVRGELARNQMNAGGVWIGRNFPEDHAGVRIPSMATPFMPFHVYAAGLLMALAELAKGNDEPLKHWTIHEDARPWTPKKIVVTEESIAARVRGDMPRGVVPHDARMLTGFIDVQDDCVYAHVWAWSIRAGKPYGHLVDHSRCVDLDAAEREFSKRPWKTADGRAVRLEMTFVDSGDNAMDVYRWTNRRNGNRVRPSKGESISGGGKFYRHADQDDGNEHRGRLIKLFTEELKDYFAGAMEQGRITFHASALEDADFQTQMCSEERVQAKAKRGRGGKKRATWAKRQGHDANHHWDCAIGSLGAAVFKRMVRNDWRWRKEFRKRDEKPESVPPDTGAPENEPGAIAPNVETAVETRTEAAHVTAPVATKTVPSKPKPPAKRVSLFGRGSRQDEF